MSQRKKVVIGAIFDKDNQLSTIVTIQYHTV